MHIKTCAKLYFSDREPQEGIVQFNPENQMNQTKPNQTTCLCTQKRVNYGASDGLLMSPDTVSKLAVFFFSFPIWEGSFCMTFSLPMKTFHTFYSTSNKMNNFIRFYLYSLLSSLGKNNYSTNNITGLKFR